MDNTERDQMIVEMHTDIKWLKEWATEHKSLHNKYFYYYIITVAGVVVGLIFL